MYQDTYWKDLDDVQREMNRLHNGKQVDRTLQVHPLLRE